MSGDSEIGSVALGSIAHALGKIERGQEESDKQRAKLFDKIEQVGGMVAEVRREQAASNATVTATLEQHGRVLAEIIPKVAKLEEAQQQRNGAGKVGAALGHGASAAGGGVFVWALQNIQRILGHG